MRASCSRKKVWFSVDSELSFTVAIVGAKNLKRVNLTLDSINNMFPEISITCRLFPKEKTQRVTEILHEEFIDFTISDPDKYSIHPTSDITILDISEIAELIHPTIYGAKGHDKKLPKLNLTIAYLNKNKTIDELLNLFTTKLLP